MSSPSSANPANELSGLQSTLTREYAAPAYSLPDRRRTAAREDADAARLSVCMIPYCLDNPYQRELAHELRRHGATVTARDGLRGLLAGRWGRRGTLDVVHLHWLRMFQYRPLVILRQLAFVGRLALLRRWGCGVVWTVHNLYGHEARHPWMERLIARAVARCATRLIVHSPGAVDLVAREFGLPNTRKIVVVPHGNYLGSYANSLSRADARRRLGVSPTGTVFLFLGKIRPYKGVRELVTTFQQFQPPEAELVIAGAPLNAEVEQEVRDTIQSPAVHFHPRFVADEEIQTYMNAADAVVLPYQDALTSGAVVLAMSFGKACIAARVGCIPDMIDDRGAFLFDPGRPEALRQALAAAHAARDRLPEMGQRNLERAREWSWERIARETAAVYRAAASA